MASIYFAFNFSCAYQQTERSSTRLHAPPGGKTSISFGDYSEPAKTTSARATRGAQPPSSISFGADNVPPTASTGSKSLGSYMQQAAPSVAAPVAPVTQQYTPASTISGNGYRVRQQPGGTSSIVIG